MRKNIKIHSKNVILSMKFIPFFTLILNSNSQKNNSNIIQKPCEKNSFSVLKSPKFQPNFTQKYEKKILIFTQNSDILYAKTMRK